MSSVEERADFHRALRGVLQQHLSTVTTSTTLRSAYRHIGMPTGSELTGAQRMQFLARIESSVSMFLDARSLRQLREKLQDLSKNGPAGRAALATRTIQVEEEDHIVTARSQAREVCIELGFERTEQIKIATAVSELARNIVSYAGSGEITITPVSSGRRGLKIESRDKGPGIGDLDSVLDGTYQSKSGLGVGLRGCKKLMDEFYIQSSRAAGTTVLMRKYL